MSEGEKFEQQSFFDDQSEDKKEEKEEPLKRKLYRDKVDSESVEKESKEKKDRYFPAGTCIKMYENERRLLFLRHPIIATSVGDGKRDKEGFERFAFKANAKLQNEGKEYVRADRGNFNVCFGLDPDRNILWIRAKDGSIRKAKKYLKENRIGLSD